MADFNNEIYNITTINKQPANSTPCNIKDNNDVNTSSGQATPVLSNSDVSPKASRETLGSCDPCGPDPHRALDEIARSQVCNVKYSARTAPVCTNSDLPQNENIHRYINRSSRTVGAEDRVKHLLELGGEGEFRQVYNLDETSKQSTKNTNYDDDDDDDSNQYENSLIKFLKNTKNDKKIKEYFATLVTGNNKKNTLVPFSLIDNCYLKTPLKGKKMGIPKKNTDSRFIQNIEDGVNMLDETFLFINMFNKQYDPNLNLNWNFDNDLSYYYKDQDKVKTIFMLTDIYDDGVTNHYKKNDYFSNTSNKILGKRVLYKTVNRATISVHGDEDNPDILMSTGDSILWLQFFRSLLSK